MASKINATDAKRGDGWKVFPQDLVVDYDNAGRTGKRDPEVVKALAMRILAEGQLQPVVTRKIHDNRLQLVAGFGRHAAVTYINTVLQPDNPIRLACTVIDCSPEEAFIKNLSENLDRENTTPMDDANNQRKLREQHGWSEAKISEFYKCSVATVSQLRKTLSLPAVLQEQVAAKTLPVSTAIEVADLPVAEQVAVVQAATESNGQVNGETVKKRVREHKIAQGKGKGRSLKECKDFFMRLVMASQTEAVHQLSIALVDFISGKITDEQMTTAMTLHTADPIFAEWPKSEQASTELVPA